MVLVIQERNNMRKKISFFWYSSVALLVIVSCSRSIAPSALKSDNAVLYDESKYSYYYVEAIRQKLMGNFGDALKYFEQCINLNPLSDGAYYQSAQILLANGDTQNGKKLALKALSIGDKNLWYLMTVSGLYYQEKKLDSAIYYYEKAEKYFPENQEVVNTLGNLYTENRNFSKASALYNTIEKKYGLNDDMAVSFIHSLTEDRKYDEALIKTKALLESKPDNIVYNGLLADIYSKRGEVDKAKDVYEKLVEANPDNAQIQIALSGFLLDKKEYDDFFKVINNLILNDKVALQDKMAVLGRAIEIPDIVKDKSQGMLLTTMVLEANYKDNAIVPLLRADLLIKMNRLSDAAERLEDIVSKNNDNYYAWEKLLLVYLQIPDYNMLMKRGEECATKFNTSYLPKVLYANGAIETGKFDIAQEELRKAEILAGEDKDQLLQIYTMRADIFYRLKDYQNSFENFEKALSKDKSDLTVLNNYAYYLAEQNSRLKDAEEMAGKVVQKDPNNTTFLDTYAWVLYKRGKVKEASEIMEKIIKSGQKQDAVWYEHYGYILKKQKKYDKAIENWETAIKIDNSKTGLLKEIENCRR